MMTPIQEALVAGVIASVPSCAGLLIALGRMRQLMKDYPPHSHVNGSIVYPRGFEPPEVRQLDRRAVSAGAGK